MSAPIDTRTDQVIRELLSGVSGPALVVTPSADVLEALVETLADMGTPPTVRVLAVESTLKDVIEDFLVASRAADLVETGILTLRVTDLESGNELVVTEHRLTALVAAGETLGALSTEEPELVDAAYGYYTDAWEGAGPFRLRTPPLSRVRETLRDEIGPGTEADFNAVLGSLDTARGDGEGLDEVTISLLVAAKNEELLYDISKWGEDVGIASKATFSRTKTMLEEFGLIDTEKVPIDVGRPRLRLKFAHDQLEDTTADELASVAKGLLS